MHANVLEGWSIRRLDSVKTVIAKLIHLSLWTSVQKLSETGCLAHLNPWKEEDSWAMIALQKVEMKWKVIFDKDEWLPWLIKVEENFRFSFFCQKQLLFISKQIVGYIETPYYGLKQQNFSWYINKQMACYCFVMENKLLTQPFLHDSINRYVFMEFVN